MTISSLTVHQALIWGAEMLANNGVIDQSLCSEILLSRVLLTDRTHLLLYPDKAISPVEQTDYIRLIEKRGNREPLAYILGESEFWSHRFKVTQDTLIPRPETEILVEEVLKCIKHKGPRRKNILLKILDIGTGCGNIPISLISEDKGISFIAIDSSRSALMVAKENALNLQIENKIDFIQTNLMNPPFYSLYNKTNFDIIVSNPPYIRSDEIRSLMPEVSKFEPKEALDGGTDGLFYYKEIIKGYPDMLVSGGELILEIGFDQAVSVSNLIKQCGAFHNLKIIKDLSAIERIIVAQKI